MNTLTLEKGGKWGSHKGEILHSQLIGLPEGSVIANSAGIEYLALKPLLSDFVLSMPRGANIIYPKDAGQIIAQGDIHPGATVVEAGLVLGDWPAIFYGQLGPRGIFTALKKAGIR